MNCTSCCGSLTGSRRNTTAFNRLKIAVFAPMPSATDSTAVNMKPGDFVNIRTGRMTIWPKQEYLAVPMPGINLAGARYLCEETGAMVIGSDTAALEAFPSDAEGYSPVHCYMFSTTGTPIVENLWLEELAAARRYEFALISPPLKLRGATGAFMRPLAVPLRT